jgi:hypothetical protein
LEKVENLVVFSLTARRFVDVCSCSSNSRRRCSVKPVDIGVLYFDRSSLIVPFVVDSNAVFNSPTRPPVGRSVL